MFEHLHLSLQLLKSTLTHILPGLNCILTPFTCPWWYVLKCVHHYLSKPALKYVFTWPCSGVCTCSLYLSISTQTHLLPGIGEVFYSLYLSKSSLTHLLPGLVLMFWSLHLSKSTIIHLLPGIIEVFVRPHFSKSTLRHLLPGILECSKAFICLSLH